MMQGCFIILVWEMQWATHNHYLCYAGRAIIGLIVGGSLPVNIFCGSCYVRKTYATYLLMQNLCPNDPSLLYMFGYQAKVFNYCTCNVLYIFATHETKDYKFKLIILVVVDEWLVLMWYTGNEKSFKEKRYNFGCHKQLKQVSDIQCSVLLHPYFGLMCSVGITCPVAHQTVIRMQKYTALDLRNLFQSFLA